MTSGTIDADLAGRLADVALATFHGAGPGWGVAGPALRQLADLADTGLDDDQRAWAARLAVPDGRFPLTGASAWAATYPALLWNGDRCARAGLPPAALLTLAALATAGPDQDAAALGPAVAAGLAVAGELERPSRAGSAVARATTDAVASAACAALAAGTAREPLRALLDLAGSLMVLAPASVGEEPVYVRGAWRGHAAAAGWLAVQAAGAGIVGFDGGLAHTLSVVAGFPQDRGGPVPAVTALQSRPPRDVSIRAVIEALA